MPAREMIVLISATLSPSSFRCAATLVIAERKLRLVGRRMHFAVRTNPVLSSCHSGVGDDATAVDGAIDHAI